MATLTSLSSPVQEQPSLGHLTRASSILRWHATSEKIYKKKQVDRKLKKDWWFSQSQPLLKFTFVDVKCHTFLVKMIALQFISAEHVLSSTTANMKSSKVDARVAKVMANFIFSCHLPGIILVLTWSSCPIIKKIFFFLVYVGLWTCEYQLVAEDSFCHSSYQPTSLQNQCLVYAMSLEYTARGNTLTRVYIARARGLNASFNI